jgi:hypothetical protein
MNSMKMAAAPVMARPSQVEARSGLKMPDIKEIEGKTFYHLDGKWVDSEVKDKPADKVVKTWSEAYFSMVKQFPVLARYFSLGEKVIVKFENKIIEINPSRGIEKP